MSGSIIQFVYLAAAVCFILALKWLNAVKTSRQGVYVGVIGMLLAVVGTLFEPSIEHYLWLATAIVIGSFIGVPLAMMPMTAVPQRTALSHAFGALAVTLGSEEAAELMRTASTIMIVPGYGMAVAQAQHKVRELYDILTRQGVDVRFAIHPVAGRMPGHMNVLLAEADIPYDKLIEMDDANDDLPQIDISLIIGANDVTNPAARHDKSSPIYGMPILNVDKSRMVMVIKRGMNPGFAGVDNELYYMDKTQMLFGDAKAFVSDLVKELSRSE